MTARCLRQLQECRDTFVVATAGEQLYVFQ